MSDDFLLYDPNAIRNLKDRASFIEIIGQFYVKTAEAFGCSVSVSSRRLGEAYDFWIGDEARALHFGTEVETTELDHFKHAAFIAFWLRRLIPISDIWFDRDDRVAAIAGDADSTAPSEAQIRFYRVGNELTALLVGFYICLGVETLQMTQRITRAGNTRVISDATGVRQIPGHFLTEYPKLMKHKNVSPHALYMVYRSLFDTLEWTVEGREAA